MKVLYFDTETTGLDPDVYEICQLSWVVEIDGDPVYRGNLLVKPTKPADAAALGVHGMSMEYLEANGLSYRDAHRRFTGNLSRYVNQYNPADKFVPCAYNAQFDIGFLTSFFRACEDRYLGSWIDLKRVIDPLPVLRFLRHCGQLDLCEFKLVQVASYYGIALNAHDAASDCDALRQVVNILKRSVFYEKVMQ